MNNIDNVVFSEQDSSVTIFLVFDKIHGVKNVYASVNDPNGKILFDELFLYDNGYASNKDLVKDDLKFTNYFFLSQDNVNGRYGIKYLVILSNDDVKEVALQYFNYDNKTSNKAPEISNLILEDSTQRNVSFVFSVYANDPNGVSDLNMVYFELYRPDGSIVIDNRTGDSKFKMFDDGNEVVYGDTYANDNIYSFKNSFGPSAPTGNWKFAFQAIDKEGLKSNVIEKNVLVY